MRKKPKEVKAVQPTKGVDEQSEQGVEYFINVLKKYELYFSTVYLVFLSYSTP